MRYHNTIVPCHLLKCPRGSLFLIPEDKVVHFEETCALTGPSYGDDEVYFNAMGPFVEYEADDVRIFSWTSGGDT